MIRKTFQDKEFLQSTLRIAVPVTLQSLIMSSLNTIDTFMITRLGTSSIAGVGLANQIFFFFSFFLFGINTGSSILFSQYFGKNDHRSVQKTLGYALKTSLLVSVVFTLAALFFPEAIIALFNDNPAVVGQGSEYLRTVSLSYIITSFSFAIGIGMRSTGNPKTPLRASFISFFVNTFFNYCFIFGKFGMPALGVKGAAIGTIIARVVEFVVLSHVLTKYRGVLFKNLDTMLKKDLPFRKNYIKVTFPVIVEEIFWSLSQVMYNFSYAKIGMDATASVQVASAISGILYVGARGLASATTVLVGMRIGEDRYDRAQDYALKSSLLAILLGTGLGLILILFPNTLLLLFPKLTPEVREITRKALIVMGIFYGVRTYNSTTVVGVLRGGGDIGFSMTVELVCAWCIGVPLSLVGVLWLGWPLYLVMALISVEEVVKAIWVTPRIVQRKWIRNVT